jgi:hypothetical protein
MLTKYNLYIGLNDKDSKQQMLIKLLVIARFKKRAACIQYTHRDGTKVLETTLIVQVIDFDNTLDIIPVVNSLKTALNQESIAVIREQVDSKLI